MPLREKRRYKIIDASGFGAVLREERRRQGYTQQEVADYSGVGITFVSQLERGKPTAELGKALRVMQTLGSDFFAEPRS